MLLLKFVSEMTVRSIRQDTSNFLEVEDVRVNYFLYQEFIRFSSGKCFCCQESGLVKHKYITDINY